MSGAVKFEFDVQTFVRSANLFQRGLSRELAPLFIKRLTFGVLERAVLRTPTITGRLKGGWQITLGKPAHSETNMEDKSGQATIIAGLSAMSGYQLGQSVWITNNVHYAGYVEFGTDKMNPVLMLTRAMEEEISPIISALGGMS